MRHLFVRAEKCRCLQLCFWHCIRKCLSSMLYDVLVWRLHGIMMLHISVRKCDFIFRTLLVLVKRYILHVIVCFLICNLLNFSFSSSKFFLCFFFLKLQLTHACILVKWFFHILHNQLFNVKSSQGLMFVLLYMLYAN